jgi:pentose-5-phosphate-3-epimerase
MQAISCQTSQWVGVFHSHFVHFSLLIHATFPGAPVLSCVSKGVPGIFMDCHMMVAEPEKARTAALSLSPAAFSPDSAPSCSG